MMMMSYYGIKSPWFQRKCVRSYRTKVGIESILIREASPMRDQNTREGTVEPYEEEPELRFQSPAHCVWKLSNRGVTWIFAAYRNWALFLVDTLSL